MSGWGGAWTRRARARRLALWERFLSEQVDWVRELRSRLSDAVDDEAFDLYDVRGYGEEPEERRKQARPDRSRGRRRSEEEASPGRAVEEGPEPKSEPEGRQGRKRRKGGSPT